MSEAAKQTGQNLSQATRQAMKEARQSMQKAKASQAMVRVAKARFKAAKKAVKHAKKTAKKDAQAAALAQQTLRGLLKKSTPQRLKGAKPKKARLPAAAQRPNAA